MVDDLLLLLGAISVMGATLKDWAKIDVVQVRGDILAIELKMHCPMASLQPDIESAIKKEIKKLGFSSESKVNFELAVQAHEVRMGVDLFPQVKNVIVVASGKGGVGKSTTAVNLALGLQCEGAKVGLLDADIYGPSIPAMLGLEGERPTSDDNKTMIPVEYYGMQVASIGFIVDPEQAVVWRGPMVTQALTQMLTQTRWQALDYLILDLPPGTGDVQLTLAKQVPITGAVIVTTPQKIAVLDTKKSIAMFEKVSIPILGVVENMAIYRCNQCGHSEHIFGSKGGEKLAEKWRVPLLASLPLAAEICFQSDNGAPIVVSDPQSEIAHSYLTMARSVASAVASRPLSHLSQYSRIKIGKGA